MEIFLTILRYASGPLIGAIIGYFTNWLAVRMLFRPYYAKRIGKFRLPFTPGIIPKRRTALAKAVGEAVGEKLFTKDDLTAALTSDSAKNKIADYAAALWRKAGDKTASDFIDRVLPDGKARSVRQSAEQFFTDKIFSAIQNLDVGSVVAREGAEAIKEKKSSLGMLAFFLTDELIASIAGKLSKGVNGYLEENGRRLVSETLKKELDKALDAPLSTLNEIFDEQTVRGVAVSLYEGAIKNAVADLAENVDVSGVVEEKINAMDVKDLEKLVLSVMKKELNAIVWLGALIGFVLGVLMIFI